MRHPVEAGHAIGDLVAALSDEAAAAARGGAGHPGI
jgi:hypothetical protein